MPRDIDDMFRLTCDEELQILPELFTIKMQKNAKSKNKNKSYASDAVNPTTADSQLAQIAPAFCS